MSDEAGSINRQSPKTSSAVYSFSSKGSSRALIASNLEGLPPPFSHERKQLEKSRATCACSDSDKTSQSKLAWLITSRSFGRIWRALQLSHDAKKSSVGQHTNRFRQLLY